MSLSSAQKIGVGALMGGVASVGTSMLLRYFADDKGTSAGAGQAVSYPIWWEHAPLVGIAGGAVATGLAYWLWGTEAAVACGMTAVVAGVAPEADGWIGEQRGAKDLEAAKTQTMKCANGAAPNASGVCADGSTPAMGRLRGSDSVELRNRIAALEAEYEEFRKAA